MHNTQLTLNRSARLPENIGTAGLCPLVCQRSELMAENNNVHSFDLNSKQHKSHLSDYGMT